MKNKFAKRICENQEDVLFLEQAGFPHYQAELLALRGVNEQNVGAFLSNAPDVFHSPLEMANMEEAAECVTYLLESGGSALICGDYDADGLTASSILYLFFRDNGVDCDIIIPTRDEGYGLHAEKVLHAFENKYYDLVITVDCGISDAAEVDKILQALDTEVIVTDHHDLPEILPNCLCVNPKMGYPFPFLAGAGVAWKLVEAVAGREAAINYADLASVGTIADLMPIVDENRSIVKAGLANFRHKGLLKLAELSKCPAPTACDVAMKIAPKINAAGRVATPDSALQLLLRRDRTDVASAEKLLELNERRKTMLDEIVADAEKMCDENTIRSEKMVFLFSDKWQHGLLGIAAARFRQRYGVPSVVMTKKDGEYVGSARGVDNVDLHEAFVFCSDVLVRFGGHKASVGFTVAEDRLDDLRNRLAEYFRALPSAAFENVRHYDVDVDGTATVAELYEFSQLLQPYLPQDKPLFRAKGEAKTTSLFGKDNNHLGFTLSGGLEFKAFFDFARFAPYMRNGSEVDVLFTLEYDAYSKNVCGIVEDMQLCNSLHFDGFYALNFVRNVLPAYAKLADPSDAARLLDQPSVVALFDDYATFMEQSEKLNFEDFSLEFFRDGVFGKTVVVSPQADFNFDKYENVVAFTGCPLERKLPKRTVYVNVTPANAELYSVKLNRDVCVATYSALRKKGKFDSIHGAYDKFLTGKLEYTQFVLAIRVFVELGLIKIVDKYTVEFCDGVKSDLANSFLYKFFARQ